MLGVGVLCVLLITYFNFRSAGQQQENFTQRIGEGRELYEYAYPVYFQDDAISPQRLARQDTAAVAVLFWGSWSGRSVEALRELEQIAASFSETPAPRRLHIIAAAIKDGEDFIREIRRETPAGAPVYFAAGDEIYNELRLPGLPSVVVFDASGKLHGARYGYSGPADYAFIRTLGKAE